MTDMGDRFRIVANVIDIVEAERRLASAARRASPVAAATRPADRRRGVADAPAEPTTRS